MPIDQPAWFLSAATFALSMSASPGPNNTMVTASGASWGFRRTVPHMLGIAMGFPVMIVAVALGAGQALSLWPPLHGVLRWAGIAYLLWLAWRTAMATPGTGAAGGATSRPLSFVAAALFQWVNPKAWVIALGAVAAYTSTDGVLAEAALLALIFFIVTLPSVAGWTLVGVGAARVLRTPRALRVFNLVMAGLLVASLATLLGV